MSLTICFWGRSSVLAELLRLLRLVYLDQEVLVQAQLLQVHRTAELLATRESGGQHARALGLGSAASFVPAVRQLTHLYSLESLNLFKFAGLLFRFVGLVLLVLRVGIYHHLNVFLVVNLLVCSLLSLLFHLAGQGLPDFQIALEGSFFLPLLFLFSLPIFLRRVLKESLVLRSLLLLVLLPNGLSHSAHRVLDPGFAVSPFLRPFLFLLLHKLVVVLNGLVLLHTLLLLLCQSSLLLLFVLLDHTLGLGALLLLLLDLVLLLFIKGSLKFLDLIQLFLTILFE